MGTSLLPVTQPRSALAPVLAWAAGAALAGLVVGLAVPGAVHDVIGADLERAPAPTGGAAAAVLAHNVPIALWPVACAALGVQRLGGHWVRFIDWLVVFSVARQVALIAAALGSYGRPLLEFLPHLPFELAGLILGAWVWRAHRTCPLGSLALLGVAVAAIALLAVAAVLETWAVPHR